MVRGLQTREMVLRVERCSLLVCSFLSLVNIKNVLCSERFQTIFVFYYESKSVETEAFLTY